MAEVLISPLAWLLCAVVLAWPAWRLRDRHRGPWRGCVALAVLAAAMMTPMAANLLVGWLERARPSAASCSLHPPPTIVVLAGGTDRRPRDAGDFSVLDAASRRRLDAGIEYWRRVPARVLVLAGGPARPGLPSNASLLAAYARWHGVPSSAIRTEEQSLTTWQSAANLAVMAIPRRLALATSAVHMDRARFAFASAGFEVCPLPTDYRQVPFALPWSLVPRSSALQKSEDALHELAGLAYYHWLSWTDAMH